MSPVAISVAITLPVTLANRLTRIATPGEASDSSTSALARPTMLLFFLAGTLNNIGRDPRSYSVPSITPVRAPSVWHFELRSSPWRSKSLMM